MKLTAIWANIVDDLSVAITGVALAEVVIFVWRVACAFAVVAFRHHVSTSAVTMFANLN